MRLFIYVFANGNLSLFSIVGNEGLGSKVFKYEEVSSCRQTD
jgi:hypothetical protein